ADRTHRSVAVEHRVGNGRASGGLCCVDAEGAFFDEAGTAELRGRGRGTREERAGPDRYDDVVRKPPPELLCALEEERLRPFGVVRAEREVHESPPLLVREPGTQPVELVVRPGHAYLRPR